VTALAILISGAAVAYGLWRIGDLLERQSRQDTVRQLVATFAPSVAAVQRDPKQLLAWYPVVQTSRTLFPDAFKELDRGAGGSFPFSKEQLQAAHARCTSDWLAWEHANEAEFALKTAQVQDDIDRAGHTSPLLRTRLAAIEQQKLQGYQQRYEEYIKTAKAIAAYSDAGL
jgi:hypothetical protein